MLSLEIIAVGKLKESWWREAADEYLRRLSPFARTKVVEVDPSPITPSNAPDRSKTDEGARILQRCDGPAFVILLDRDGKRLSSEKLAERLDAEGGTGRKMQCIIGGTAGVSGDVRERADLVISLSDMTLPHEMARVFWLEQLYRAATILAGKEYHH